MNLRIEQGEAFSARRDFAPDGERWTMPVFFTGRKSRLSQRRHPGSF